MSPQAFAPIVRLFCLFTSWIFGSVVALSFQWIFHLAGML